MFGRRRKPAADAAAFLNGTKAMVFGDVLIDNFLPDDLDTYGEWAKELHAWSCTSAAFLLFFGALHIAVRIAARFKGQNDASSSFLVRTLWHTLFAVFPESKPLLTPQPAIPLSTLTKTMSVAKLLKKRLLPSSEDAPAAAPPPVPPLKRAIRSVVAVIDVAIAFLVLDLAIACVVPIALGLHMAPFQLAGKVILSMLVAARIVAPLGHEVHETTEGIISNWQAATGAEHSFGHLRSLPSILQGACWLVWGGLLGSTLGVNVTAIWSSLGASGLLLGLALQHYAADIVGGFTLLADGRFNYGDCITIGSNGWTVVVRQVGLLQTRCTKVDGGQACSIPNSVLVRSPLVNESRIKVRRLDLFVIVDGATPPDKLSELPGALLGAAAKALAEKKVNDVTFAYAEHGNACDLVDVADERGVKMQISLNMPTSGMSGEYDGGRWKRLKSAVLLGMHEELHKRGVALGRRAERVHQD